jgi:BirA family biotin operon repressor/biotin-[acetyl-CoA-carboxylase] ligase
VRLGTVTSTNDEAKKLASEGAGEGTTVVAAEQTKGRGTRGRVWLSGGENLYLSVILRPQIGPERFGELAFVAAVALARTLRRAYDLDAAIKWPNDVHVGGRKVAGILVEVARGAAVVGIGVNVNWDELPEEIATSATSLGIELGRAVDVDGLLGNLLTEIECVYREYASRGFPAVLDEWRELADTIGTDVAVRWSGGIAAGRAVDVDETGALVIETADGQRVTVNVGIIL